MRVHHLNCGSLRKIEPADGQGLKPLPAVCHCLLVETEQDGLVLVETGFGLLDIESPTATLGEDFLGWAQPVLDPAETAVRQIVRLGYAPDDVRHVLLTHLHRDHTGGLPDFPHARVHVSKVEHQTVMTGGRRSLLHFAHDPHWVFYDAAGGDRWHDFHHVRQPAGMSAEILLVPLGGHSPGHTAVAVQAGDGWLLHVGDAYYYRSEIQPDPAPVPPLLNSLQEMMETDRALRLANLERLRRLVADPSAQVQVMSAHDPWEFQRYSSGDQGTAPATCGSGEV
ncbi:MAG TPA: MBL fold metallo-hydrolase [Micromonosporaceae bacterium]|nr:MBL fold metallo-hydrolase [Micromonosporaceae bacterium]